MLQGIRGPARLGHVLAHHARYQQRAVLEVVRRRSTERLLQLRRPPPDPRPQQGRDHVGARARVRRHTGDHVSGALPARQRVRGAPAGLLWPEDRGHGDLPPADGARPAGVDAGMRSPRSHPLGGLRRVQRCGVRWPDRGLEEPHPDHHGRLLPKRRADRPQGQGGRGAGAGPGGRRRGREGAGVAPPRRPVRIEEPHGGRPRLLRRRGVEGLPSAGDRTGLHAGRGAVVHHVFEWDDRPAQGLPTQHGRVPLLRRRHLEVLPGHPPQRHVLVLRRHRGGSRGTPTSCTGPWRSARRA